MQTSVIVALVLGLVLGVAAGLMLGRLSARSSLSADTARAEAERDVLRERVADLEAVAAGQADAAHLLAPVLDTLGRVERQVGVLERDRSSQFGALDQHLSLLGATQESLHRQTAALSQALSSSTVRGAWGEVQLRRLLEHAGMLQRCDVDEQVSRVSLHDKAVRPDAVVHLPGDRHLVIDSKAPMTHWLRAHAEGIEGEERAQLVSAHALALRRHVEQLAGKAYWSAFTESPQFVVCFLPSDALVAAALGDDPALFEHALGRKVVLASPGTLFALLKTVASVWQQDAMHENAKELLALGDELYARLGTLGGHLVTMGSSLSRTVESYNRLVGALEARVLVTARRMHELKVTTSDPIAPTRPLEVAPRTLSAPEIMEGIADRPGERDEAFLLEQAQCSDPTSAKLPS